MAVIKNLLGALQIEILLCANSIWHFCEVLEISASYLHFACVLVHLQEALHLLTYHLLDVLWHFFALQVFQELFYEFLLLVCFLSEVLFQRLVNLLILLLCLLLIFLELVLLLKLAPDRQLAHEVAQ